MWGDEYLVELLEYTLQVSAVILLLCAIYYYRFFKKMKRERKLTPIEYSMYIITQIAYLLCGGSYILLLLDK